MAISSNIPLTRVPGSYTEIDNTRANQGAYAIQYRVLHLGQMLSSGTAMPLVPVRVTSKEQAQALFGPGSMLAIMAEAAFASNDYTEQWFLPLEDAQAGVAATGSVKIGGAQTSAGAINLYIGGRRVQSPVLASDTLDDIASTLAATINADGNLPVTAAADGTDPATVNLTAKNKGEAGNGIDLRTNYQGETTAPGLTVTITPLSGGANNPELTNAIAAIGDEWFHIWSLPYTDAANLVLVEAELADRFEPMREIEGHAIAAARGTHAQLGTLGDSRNSSHLSIMSAAYEPMPPFAKAAETAAIVAYYAEIDPARPFQTLAYSYCLPPAEADRFTENERNLLLYDGIATSYVDAGGVMRIERMVTTYKTNSVGASDTSYLDLNTLLTLMYLRHDWKDYIRSKYPRHKVADDGTRFGAGQAVVTPNLVKAEAIARFSIWEELGLVEDIDDFKANLIVERNAQDPNRIDVLMPPDIINQLRVVATVIQFRV